MVLFLFGNGPLDGKQKVGAGLWDFYGFEAVLLHEFEQKPQRNGVIPNGFSEIIEVFELGELAHAFGPFFNELPNGRDNGLCVVNACPVEFDGDFAAVAACRDRRHFEDGHQFQYYINRHCQVRGHAGGCRTLLQDTV